MHQMIHGYIGHRKRDPASSADLQGTRTPKSTRQLTRRVVRDARYRPTLRSDGTYLRRQEKETCHPGCQSTSR